MNEGDGRGRRRAGGPIEFEPGTLPRLFLNGTERHRRADAMLRRRSDSTWESYSHGEIAELVREASLGLRSLGFERGERIGIVAHTRMEWAVADYAVIMAGLVSVPVYPTLPAEQMAYVLRSAGARAAFLAGADEYSRALEAREELPELERAIVFEDVKERDALPALGLAELRERGREARELAPSYEEFALRTEPDDLATIIYTSGTTGPPKGVMLTHNNFYSNAVLSCRVLPISERDLALSFLPLAHVFERTAGHYVMWHGGAAVAYAESTETVGRDMGEVRPTIMTAVPRVYEKFYERAAEAARRKGRLAERVFGWAKGVGEARARRTLAGKPMGPWLSVRYAAADTLIFRPIRDRTGGRMRYFVSGGGPLPEETARFMWGTGLPVLEGYGLTETSPVLAVNPPGDVRVGTVGPPIPGTEIRIDDDGEILCRGPQVMKGYYGNEEATRATFTEDGWLRTGDIGELDPDGYLRITDRKKEILVTSYGKNIAPQPVEVAIRRSPYVEYAVLIGDRRKFPIVLVVPAISALERWAAERGLRADRTETLLEEEAVVELLEREVEDRTEEFAEYARPKKVLTVPGPFTVESGELTPTDKVKRRVVEERYAEAIDRAYRVAEREWEERRDERAAAEEPS